jgi:phosphoenolpyruvate carboxylase
MADTGEVRALLDQAFAAVSDDTIRLSLLVLRASIAGHGLGLAHTHVRLNATQIHNSIRSQVGLVTSPSDPSRRRSYLNAVNDLLAKAEPQSINYGSILSEHASARRLFMIVAQMLKHVDAETPVRLLIAETEAGFTLLAALYFAKLFGIEERIEISPLFETDFALNHGERIIDEALKNPHYRAYVEQIGRLTIQFGFSDSGRYLGQMAATFLIERLRHRLAATLERHRLTGVELVLFNTHGESIGRGAHPVSFADRMLYLCPPAADAAFHRLGIAVKEEISFQGGDGFLWFMHPAAALAALRALLESRAAAFAEETADPIYERSDFAAEFFNTVEQFFARLVEDPDYAALLGVFGTNLLEPTGSRPVKRVTDTGGGAGEITHPSQMRAIPNNAVLQQLGMLANVVTGLGRASSQDPESFAALYAASPRFRRALDMAVYALSLSNPDTLAAYIGALDPLHWLDRAAEASRDADTGLRDELRRVAGTLEHLGVHDRLMKMHRILFEDAILLRDNLQTARGEEPRAVGLAEDEREELAILHALRIALIQRLWLLATHVPDFSPQLGTSVEDLIQRLIHLDVENVVARLKQIFPISTAGRGEPEAFGEMATYFADSQRTYEREHLETFEPMLRLYRLIRRVSAAVTHHAGAVG